MLCGLFTQCFLENQNSSFHMFTRYLKSSFKEFFVESFLSLCWLGTDINDSGNIHFTPKYSIAFQEDRVLLEISFHCSRPASLVQNNVGFDIEWSAQTNRQIMSSWCG